MSLVVVYRILLRCRDCGAVEERDEASAPTAVALAGLAAGVGTVEAACPCAEGAAVVVETIEVVIGDTEITVGADGRLYEGGGGEVDQARLAALMRGGLPLAA
jgi:hypothetical protein